MRFAWRKKETSNNVATMKGQASTHKLVMTVYNVVWWVPVVLPVIRVIDYRTGFFAFLMIAIIRVAVNMIRNNVLSPEHADAFPLRSP